MVGRSNSALKAHRVQPAGGSNKPPRSFKKGDFDPASPFLKPSPKADPDENISPKVLCFKLLESVLGCCLHLYALGFSARILNDYVACRTTKRPFPAQTE
jgi:hypothetical protein